jgi:TP901 family phage tail tape measure protein
MELSLGIRLGVIGAGAVGAALGSVRGSLDGLGRVMGDLRRRQVDLGDAIHRHMGTLAPRTLAALNRDYERLGRAIDDVRKRQEALGRAMARRQALADERARLGGEIMGTYATAAAVGAPVIASVAEAAGFGDAIKDIAIVGELSREQERVLGESLRAIARETNQAARDMAAGVSMLIANGMEAGKAAEQARLLGKFTTATRASMDDAARMMVSFDLLGVSAKDMELAFAQAAKAGKLGSFEVRDMAKWFPQLGGYLKALGVTGNEAVVNMASRLQIAMRTAGSTDEAANNFRNFLTKLTSPDTKKDFEKLGIDLQGSMLRAARQGLDPIEAGVGIIMDKMAQRSPKVAAELKALSDEIARIKDPAARAAELERRRAMIEALGERAGLGQMFQDMQAMSYLLAEVQNRADLKKIQAETATGKGASGQSALDEDFAKRMESPIEQFKRFKIALQDLAMTVGDALLPPLMDIVRAVQPAVAAFAAWAKEHPVLIKGLIGAALGMAALKAAVLSGAWALNFFVKSPLALLGVGWRTLAARVAIGRAALIAGASPLRAIGAAAGLSGGMLARLGAAFVWMRGAAVTALMAVGRAVLWLGRAMLANPVGLVLAAIAGAAYLIWRNWDKIGPLLGKVWDHIKSGFDAAWTWLKGLPARMLDIGQQIVSGLIDGIKAKLGAARDAVLSLGATVRDGLKNLLGIRSPSRVFAELGGFLGDGLSQGMRASLGAVRAAAGAMAGAAMMALAPPALAAPAMQAMPDALRTIRQTVALSTPDAPKAAGAGSQGPAPMQITFAPQITVPGAASPEAAREAVIQAVRMSFAEFERLMRRYESERRRVGWEATT